MYPFKGHPVFGPPCTHMALVFMFAFMPLFASSLQNIIYLKWHMVGRWHILEPPKHKNLKMTKCAQNPKISFSSIKFFWDGNRKNKNVTTYALIPFKFMQIFMKISQGVLEKSYYIQTDIHYSFINKTMKRKLRDYTKILKHL